MKSFSYHVGTLKPLAWQSAWCSWPRRWGSESSAVHVRKGAWETASVRAREKPRPWGRVRSYRPRRPAWSRWPRRCRRCHSRPCGRAWRGRPRRCRGSVSSTAHIDVSPVWRQYYCKNVSSSFMSCSLFLLFYRSRRAIWQNNFTISFLVQLRGLILSDSFYFALQNHFFWKRESLLII